MRMGISLQQRQELRLKLAPQIIQSIEILQLAAVDLENLIKEEMEENPVLELGAEVSKKAEERKEALRKEEEAREVEKLDGEFKRLEDIDHEWRESFSTSSSYYSGEKDKKLEAMQNTAAKPASLQDYLHEQFALLDLPEEVRAAGETIIYNIDDSGYLQYPLEQIFAGSNPPVSPEVTEDALHRIQRLDPPGVGARTLTECLLIQLGDDPSYELERQIVTQHWDDLMKNRLPKIAKALGEDLEIVKESVQIIGQMNPRPGLVYSSEPPTYVIPDVIVDLVDGRYEVRLADDWIPRIHISSRYRKMLEVEKENKQVRDYIRKKLEAAKWLIESIEQRQNTLLKISREIVDFQKPFLDHGIDFLKPLKMQYIADKVGVHVSTVSRAIRDKYMQSPRGIFALKYFFTGGTTTDEGESESILAVKQKVRDIVSQENKLDPLSDDAIAQKLKEVFGLDIARRTVTKYRKQLGLLSSRQRREY